MHKSSYIRRITEIEIIVLRRLALNMDISILYYETVDDLPALNMDITIVYCETAEYLLVRQLMNVLRRSRPWVFYSMIQMHSNASKLTANKFHSLKTPRFIKIDVNDEKDS